ncbi:hypothetical protein FOG13_01065 [Neisseria meningitidis]|nr:hypothetical protein [Neisseria meningitidis]MBG8838349.1 hypothetical protein [Neisseria meningitidis]MBG8848848.1 hypothetical protein [Neisseria meningitidis]MBG8851103.1 hypothetical protein [Neisseria meningitidis]MBG8857359.1 hypothetical protein [Neisseria meningitidis]
MSGGCRRRGFDCGNPQIHHQPRARRTLKTGRLKPARFRRHCCADKAQSPENRRSYRRNFRFYSELTKIRTRRRAADSTDSTARRGNAVPV